MFRYVLQLAIADALFLLTIPFKVYQDIYQSWSLPAFICVAKETVVHLNYNASVLFLVVSGFLFFTCTKISNFTESLFFACYTFN